MHPRGAKKNKLAHAIFSNEGPNLMSPALTNKPKVIPKMYKLKNKQLINFTKGKDDVAEKSENKLFLSYLIRFCLCNKEQYNPIRDKKVEWWSTKGVPLTG